MHGVVFAMVVVVMMVVVSSRLTPDVLHHEGEHRPPNLDGRLIVLDPVVLVEEDESTELALVIKDEELSVLVPEESMHSGDRDIADSEVTLVSPSQSDGIILMRDYQTEHGGLLVAVAAVVDLLEDDVGTPWLLHRDQLMELSSVLDVPGERLLTHLALELLPCVGGGVVVGPGHDFVFDPVLEAREVDTSRRPSTLAWVQEEGVDVVLVSFFFFHETVPAHLGGGRVDFLVVGVEVGVVFERPGHLSDL